MTEIAERLYNLLPGIYRQGDSASDDPLRALLGVLERELSVIEYDIEATYDNWFVQTCDVWVLPYLADLVGIRSLEGQSYVFGTQRRQVANAVAYGRRKGTIGVLEHVLRDVTGWHIRAVELAPQVAATPRLTDLAEGALTTANLRDSVALARIGGPFSRQGYSADVRTIAPAAVAAAPGDRKHAGRYNLGRIGLFVWRLRSYTMRRCPIQLVDEATLQCVRPRSDPAGLKLYALDPSGRTLQLFNQPAGIDDVSERIDARHIPLPITRIELAADLDAYRSSAIQPIEYRAPSSAYYGPGRGLMVAVLKGSGSGPEPIPPDQVASVDLTGVTSATLSAIRRRGIRVAIDPDLGWIAVLDNRLNADDLVVDYAYGFSSEIGGGPYHRKASYKVPADTRLIVVARGTACASLSAALAEWKEMCRVRKPDQALKAVIRILDNSLYDDEEHKLLLTLPPGAELTIAADNGVRPTISARCRLVVSCDQVDILGSDGETSALVERFTAQEPASRLLRLDGLRLDGGLHVEWQVAREEVSRLGVRIRHCTIAPGVDLNIIDECARATLVEIERSIIGPLRAPGALIRIVASDTIIDGAPDNADLAAKGYAVAGIGGGFGAPCDLTQVTVLGGMQVVALGRKDSLITGQVSVKSDQKRGQHQTVAPHFTATRLGEPGYGQLHQTCPIAIRRGAEDGGELGAFHHLHQAQAAENLARTTDEYLPLGLDAGVFYMT